MFAVSFVVLFALSMLHIWNAPFTKVEESFNLQAMHDVLYHGSNIGDYDHVAFPGVVPRTFIGALMVASVAAPLHWVLRLLVEEQLFTKLWAQYLGAHRVQRMQCTQFDEHALSQECACGIRLHVVGIACEIVGTCVRHENGRCIRARLQRPVSSVVLRRSAAAQHVCIDSQYATAGVSGVSVCVV
jgi:hypothetical protein